jgi:hypothetical protein
MRSFTIIYRYKTIFLQRVHILLIDTPPGPCSAKTDDALIMADKTKNNNDLPNEVLKDVQTI